LPNPIVPELLSCIDCRIKRLPFRGAILGNRKLGSIVQRNRYEQGAGEGLRLAEPKSDRAKQQLRIPQLCLMALLNHRVTQDKEREWAGSKWKDGGFVFTTGLGTPMHPDDISRLFPTVLKAAKLPKVRFHDLRHSCATLLLSLGVHAKLVQETLGHFSYQLTMDTYSHMIPALRNEVADRMHEILSTTVKEAVKLDTRRIN
jgi:integrase